MEIVLDTFACAESLGEVSIEMNGDSVELWPQPFVFILDGQVACRSSEDAGDDILLRARALLDTGTDVTVINPKMISDIENERGMMLHPERRIDCEGEMRPAYDLTYVFPGGYSCSSKYGFISMASHFFDQYDLLLGQDILNQLVITFNGIRGTVTILAPDNSANAVDRTGE